MVTAVRRWLPQQGRPTAQFPIPEYLWQKLALGLWQQHDAKDAQEGTGRQYHMLQESSMAHVEALSWTAQPPERPKCHDQAQATAPDSGGDDFSSKEGTEDSRSLGGEESEDREGCDGSIVQIIPQAQQDQGCNPRESH